MQPAARGSVSLALLACCVASGCGSDGGALSVDLRTDFVAGSEFAHVQTLLARQPFGTGGESRQHELDVVSGADFTRSIRVAEFAGVEQGAQYLRVTLTAPDGSSVADRDVTIDYGGDLALTVTITRTCRGVVCPGAADPATHTACFGGSCIDPHCRPEAAETCAPPQCTSDATCADGAGCLRGKCTDGACLLAPDDAACGAGQRCVPTGSCATAPPDAGPSASDAGPGPTRVDAGLARVDAGASFDAGPGPTRADAGLARTDAGLARTDAGPARTDAGRILGTMFCPESPTTRQQAAVFIVKLIHGTGFVPPPATGTFGDVDVADMFAPWVEQLARDGITTGCMPGMYCPTLALARQQAAVFIVRAMHGAAFVPPPAVGMFSDVAPSASFAPFVEQLARDGITTGCGGGMFCPDAALVRRQAAVMILRASHGAAYTPPAATGTLFTDVPLSLAEAAWIERFATEGFSTGCGG